MYVKAVWGAVKRGGEGTTQVMDSQMREQSHAEALRHGRPVLRDEMHVWPLVEGRPATFCLSSGHTKQLLSGVSIFGDACPFSGSSNPVIVPCYK